MSARVVYLGRAAAGGILRNVRVVGERTTESWDATIGDNVDPVDAIDQARSAAKWIVERLKAAGATRHATLVVDVDGASCSWLTVPSPEASVVAAAMEHSDSSPLGEHGLMPQGITSAGTSVQAIGAPAGNGAATEVAGERRAVLCMPDAIVRIVLDELDSLGIVPQGVISMWHAISLAWDPSAASAGGSRQDRVVAESAQTTGIIAIDQTGTLMWTWATDGRLLTCGRQRLEQTGDGVCVEAQDISRLTSDWLGWSLQNGQSPSRIVCVVPELAGEGLSPGEIGERLGGAWPDASISMGVVDEPEQETLERVAVAQSSKAESIKSLAARPGRVHRRMHLAMAGAALAIGLLLGMHGWSQRQTAKDARVEMRSVSDAMFLRAQEVIPEIQNRAILQQVQAELSRMTGTGPTGTIEPVVPILDELERISFALSITGVEWRNLEMRSGPLLPLVSIQAFFEPGDIESMDLLEEQLNLMPGSELAGWGRSGDTRPFGRLIRASYQSQWKMTEEDGQ